MCIRDRATLDATRLRGFRASWWFASAAKVPSGRATRAGGAHLGRAASSVSHPCVEPHRLMTKVHADIVKKERRQANSAQAC
eukprot:4917017-Alexandrium_andersonii.AAC.1